MVARPNGTFYSARLSGAPGCEMRCSEGLQALGPQDGQHPPRTPFPKYPFLLRLSLVILAFWSVLSVSSTLAKDAKIMCDDEKIR